MNKPSSSSPENDAPRENPLPAVETVMDQYATSLLRYAARLVRDADAAQDVVQQVMIRYASLSKDKRPLSSKLKAWLYRCTHNQAVDLIRSEQRRKKLMEQHAVESSLRAKSEARQDERLEEVLNQVHALPDKEKQVLLLRLQEGLSYKEIASVTGFTEGHVGYLLHQAVRGLSTRIQGKEDPA